jgi:FkbH-like protein
MDPSGTELDYRSLLKAEKSLDPSSAPQKLKLALLSDAATQRFVPLLRALFHRRGVDAQIYEAPFDAIELDAYNPSSGLYRFQPDAIAILNAVQALRAAVDRWQESPAAYPAVAAARIVKVWDALQTHSRAVIVQSNFVLPYERFFGNFDHKAPESFYSVVAALNGAIVEAARLRHGVLINDLEAVASWLGRRHWFDERLWDMAKYPCALDAMPLAARNLVNIVMATRGHIVKCVVVDLDNTLWGGVIGDDGLEGIQLSEHGEGQAFFRLQHFLRGLVRRGVLLAVCSKNDMANALLPFEKHPSMVLRRDDVAVFLADWNDKAGNLRKISETLNIGLDSMVFLDDNPFERELVRRLAPEVTVPELPEDPADYVREISRLNLFETSSFSAEDSRRAELYRQEAARRQSQAEFASIEEFLASLEMRIAVARFDRFHLPRIAQLMQRSNQFNLTTRRLTETECQALMNDPCVIPLYATLADRLGGHGLVSVVVLDRGAHGLAIRDWLMSCRVLGRGVEQFLMNSVFEEARRLGLHAVTGEFIPTAKNGMVKDFFARFGFTKVAEDAGGATRWSLETAAYQPRPTLISPDTAAALL